LDGSSRGIEPNEGEGDRWKERDTVQGHDGDIHSILVSAASWAQTIDTVTVCVIPRALMASPEGDEGRPKRDGASAEASKFRCTIFQRCGDGNTAESRVPGWMYGCAVQNSGIDTCQ